MTDICVLVTVVGAFNHECRTIVVEDALAGDPASLPRIIRRAYARVTSAKELADVLARPLVTAGLRVIRSTP